MSKIGLLRLVGKLEGVSYILLLGLAMPLKYWLDMPGLMYPIGMAHGVMFVLFIFAVFLVWREHKWDLYTVFVSLLVSLIPFGTFWADKHIWAKD
jgi:integral membrane protein